MGGPRDGDGMVTSTSWSRGIASFADGSTTLVTHLYDVEAKLGVTTCGTSGVCQGVLGGGSTMLAIELSIGPLAAGVASAALGAGLLLKPRMRRFGVLALVVSAVLVAISVASAPTRAKPGRGGLSRPMPPARRA